ncbi:hypothetical protein IO49_12060 [Gallibacterium anatis]|nr:hypothetical protein IO49_12060 [Gallibacterium anatis]
MQYLVLIMVKSAGKEKLVGSILENNLRISDSFGNLDGVGSTQYTLSTLWLSNTLLAKKWGLCAILFHGTGDK